MTRDDIIRMADAAGFNWVWISEGQQRLERFYRAAYAAGAKAEREAALDLVDDYAKNNTDLRDAIRARGET